MTTSSFTCPNPSCLRPLSFDKSLVDTIQQCPHCNQRVIVPEMISTDSQEAMIIANPNPQPVPQNAPTSYQAQTSQPVQIPQQVSQFRDQEQHTEFQKARKLNMGSGCFAMLAVMFAIGVFGAGAAFTISSFIPEFNYNLLLGIAGILAGLLGLVAFVFFGYIATETAATSRGSERR